MLILFVMDIGKDAVSARFVLLIEKLKSFLLNFLCVDH